VRGWHEEARNFVETIQDILRRELGLNDAEMRTSG
jgi:hypothetical protein